ncbi:MAG: hypothetical protein EOP00_36900, partial [Pedobacter sp.]
MKNILIAILLFFSLTSNVFGQKIFKDDVYGFSMQKPRGWIEDTYSTKRLRIPIDTLSKKTVPLVSYFKFDARTNPGKMVPIVQVTILDNPTKTFEQFTASMAETAQTFDQVFQDHELIKKPEIIEINGRKAIYFISSYIFKSITKNFKLRKRTYVIPKDNYLYQLNY